MGCRALDFLDIAAHSEPRAVLIPFLRFKVHLERKDSPAAVEQLKAMMGCDDFAKEYLQIACQEAISSNSRKVAQQSLQLLHEQICGCLTSKPGEEGTVLQNAVALAVAAAEEALKAAEATSMAKAKHDSASTEQGDVEAMEVDDSNSSGTDTAQQVAALHRVMSELTTLLSKAAARLETVGWEAMFGKDQRSAMAYVEWFICTAQNIALKASDEGLAQSRCMLYYCAARFIAAHANPDLELLNDLKKCHLAGAVAAVQALPHASLGKEEKEGCMKLAQDMLKDCKSTLSVICARADAPPAKQLQSFQKHLHSTELHLALYLGDACLQAEVLGRCRQAGPACSPAPQDLMGLVEQHGAVPAVSTQAHQLALDHLLGMGGGMPCDLVALAFRKLYELSAGDAERMQLLKRVKGILAGMAAEAYPARELEWLITAAWNKGCNHQFFGRTQEAVELMCAAEALVEDCPALIAKQQMMRDTIAKLKQKRIQPITPAKAAHSGSSGTIMGT